LQVFVEKGFHAATVRDVAAAAGISVAGIYHHHPSKTDLLIDLLDRGMSEIRWRVVAARDEGGSEVERFAAMVESLALVHASLGDLALLSDSELRGLPEAERARFAAQRASVQHLLDDQAGRALRAGRSA
ncbi:TetR/AcrR family transcriptional regulator, partial [Staphylococcus aureus]|uniref:TetR/AcrR family transcriptional regulator n=1 Tax=Staphylococcus aureus TaxID=1280 RepID=UPI0020224947